MKYFSCFLYSLYYSSILSSSLLVKKKSPSANLPHLGLRNNGNSDFSHKKFVLTKNIFTCLYITLLYNICNINMHNQMNNQKIQFSFVDDSS